MSEHSNGSGTPTNGSSELRFLSMKEAKQVIDQAVVSYLRGKGRQVLLQAEYWEFTGVLMEHYLEPGSPVREAYDKLMEG